MDLYSFMHFLFSVYVGIHILSRAYAAALALALNHIGKALLYLSGQLDALDIELGRGLVSRAAMNGAETEEALLKGALQGDVHDPVKADLLFLAGEEARVDDKLVLVKVISCK